MELLIKRVLDTLAEIGGSEQVALLTVQDDVSCSVDGGFCNGAFIEAGGTFTYKGTPLEKVIKNGQAGTFPCMYIDGLPFPTHTPVKNQAECLCLPLLNEENDTVMGAAVIGQSMTAGAPDYRMQTLNMLRTLVAAAVENARLFQLATMDSLTGLYMRRYFEIRLQEEMRRVVRHAHPMSLLMLDIDYFKQINDTYGHLQGDKVLKEVADILLDCTRTDIDLPCRYGGEEFIIMLPSTSLDGAYILGDRIRQRCEEHLFHTDENTIRVTLSAGIAEMRPEYHVSPVELMQRADLMLYAAKQNGRNRVMVYRVEEHQA